MSSSALAQKLIGFVDLTRLQPTDTVRLCVVWIHILHGNIIADIERMVAEGRTGYGPVAAYCVYPHFNSAIHNGPNGAEHQPTIAIANVINFPQGMVSTSDDIMAFELETRVAIESGATEIDLVWPWRQFLRNDFVTGPHLVRAIKQVCSNYSSSKQRPVLLKVILETGGLGSREKITHAARLAIEAGADFLKTSTGFHDVGATLDAVEALLDVIIEFQSRPTAATASTPLKSSATITSPPPSSSPSVVGLKVSGGIKTFEQATLYYDMVEKKMGADWMSPRTFRIGASSLLNDLLRVSATRAV